jgi:hypothetical protein
LTECLEFHAPLCNEHHAWSTGDQAVGSMLSLVDLGDNNIEAMRNLSHHIFLECLLLGKNQISSINGLNNLSYLQVLDLSRNKLSMIEGLEQLPIRELNLSHNQLLSCEGLASLPCLSALNISHNQITTLFPLKHCSNLTFLNAAGNGLQQVRQVDFLVDMQWLQSLHMRNNPCYTKPSYRLRIVYRLSSLRKLDDIAVSHEEKVSSRHTSLSPLRLTINLLANTRFVHIICTNPKKATCICVNALSCSIALSLLSSTTRPSSWRPMKSLSCP